MKVRRTVGVARRALHSGWTTEATDKVGMQANPWPANGKTENDKVHELRRTGRFTARQTTTRKSRG
jgi:hypothetical protein